GWVRGVHAGQPDAAAPCVACQILSLPPEQADALPPALGGLRIVARVAPGGAAPSVSSVLDAVRRRGGVGGLHVTAVPDEADPLLAAFGDLLIVEPAAGDADRVAFDLKRALTRARGRAPGATLLVAAGADLAQALRDRGLGPYADAIVPPVRP